MLEKIKELFEEKRFNECIIECFRYISLYSDNLKEIYEILYKSYENLNYDMNSRICKEIYEQFNNSDNNE